MSQEPDPEAVRAADAAIDPDRLLPGEDPDSELLDDAEHWEAVYTELLAAKARILNTTLEQIEEAKHRIAQRELETDQTLLLAEIERFQRRLRHWHEREIELRGGLPDAG
jgi:hypothetical protein